VVRHLYAPAERWDQIDERAADVRQRAWTCGCAEALLDSRHPDVNRVSPACRARVLADHDAILRPAYGAALVTAADAKRFGRTVDDKRGWMFVGAGGVVVIVREVGPRRRPEVKTAYRVVPRTGGEIDDFHKAAVRKLRDKSSWKGEG
jgi:hypothetical protein